MEFLWVWALVRAYTWSWNYVPLPTFLVPLGIAVLGTLLLYVLLHVHMYLVILSVLYPTCCWNSVSAMPSGVTWRVTCGWVLQERGAWEAAVFYGSALPGPGHVYLSVGIYHLPPYLAPGGVS
jgi:hypothetical protein